MLVRYPNEEAMAFAAAKVFVDQYHLAINRTGRFSVLLSGGNTPKRMYEQLTIDPFITQINWSKVNIFWGDERCVATNDPRSNYLMAFVSLLSHVSIPDGQIHPILCTQNPFDCAKEYEVTLKEYFGESPPSFDLAFLGLGVDGHTASLFPHTQALDEKKSWVTAVQMENEDFSRITLTMPILNQAKLIVFLISGKEKTEILQKILSKEIPLSILPARMIRPIDGKLFWLVDASVFTEFP